MRWILLLVMMSLPAFGSAQETSELKTEKEKLSYSLGMDLGNQLKAKSVEIDPAVFHRGLTDALSGGKTLLTGEEATTAIADLQKAIIVREAAAAKAVGARNAAEGDTFLAANKLKEGVVTLPSGLQYKVLTRGAGKTPTAEDVVVCHYRGTLIDGREFDSSYKRGEPATLPVKGVIRGWTEVLQLIPVGSKWQVFIPPSLAYGERGTGADIGPNATLIFEIDLVAIK